MKNSKSRNKFAGLSEYVIVICHNILCTTTRYRRCTPFGSPLHQN